MKKLLYLFLTVLIVACSSEDGNNSNNSNNVDYFFEVEFCGVINRIQGNGNIQDVFGPLVNQCYGSTGGVTLLIGDITAENYVSGQNMNATIDFDNAQLGNNTGNIRAGSLNNFYIEEYLTSLGVDLSIYYAYGFVENEPMSYGEAIPNLLRKISNINLTDLGTPDGGTTIKGTYEGVWYLSSGVNEDFDIPVPIRIEFSAIRIN